MVEIKSSLYIALGFAIYFSIYFIYEAISKAGKATDVNHIILAKFRTDNKVNVRTFHSEDNHLGFSWFGSIWINDRLLMHKKGLKFLPFVLHHERYHLMHKHKLKIILMRIVFSLEWVALAFIPWYLFLPIILLSSSGIAYLCLDNKSMKFESLFEKKANEYAKRMTNGNDSIKA